MVYGLTRSNPVGGDHGDLLAALARFLRPWTYLELGVADGATFRKVAAVMAEWGGTFVGVDHAPVAPPMPDCVAADTVAYLKSLPGDSVEFVFLDSSHEYQATMQEIDQIERVLVPNGVLAMHDTYPPSESQERPGYCGDVWRAAEMLLLVSLSLESMTLPAQYGLTLARKCARRQLLWKA